MQKLSRTRLVPQHVLEMASQVTAASRDAVAGLLLTIALELAIYVVVEGILKRHAWSWLAAVWQAVFFGAFGWQIARKLMSLSDLRGDGAGGRHDSGIATTPRPQARGARSARRRIAATPQSLAGSASLPAASPASIASSTTVSGSASEGPAATAQPSPLVTRLIKELENARLQNASRFDRFRYEFPYPFESVISTLQQKYRPPQDPLNPSIVAVRTVKEDTVGANASGNAGDGVLAEAVGEDRAVLAQAGAATHRVREIVATVAQWVPSWALRWIGIEALTLVETTLTFHSARAMRLTLINRELQDHGILREGSVYYADPANPRCNTVYECCLDLQANGRIARTMLSTLLSAQGDKGARADELLKTHIEHMNTRLRELYGAPVAL
jgi:hypothetical protein